MIGYIGLLFLDIYNFGSLLIIIIWYTIPVITKHHYVCKI